ncbi:uncharacterized protein HaLaN_13212 [Haematococcus lacustris]|uniref:Uncharacterized protein n=1 Tax=Haematococcus lacustris TaxID=44745 RepID=A0A699Z5A3_HAELA|nr:uncharacterized protein HaLaN_13212 [Haematococcus lacustris]
MGSLLVSHPDSKQPTAEEKLEEKKAEFAAKISSLISRGVSKVPADMHLPKVPVLPPRAPEVPSAVKASWSSKLQASRSAVMASVTKRLGQEKVYEPLSQEELGVAVQTSLGSTLDVFAGLQGTLSSVEKWALVRHAAEQVLQALPPHCCPLAVYASAVDAALNQGQVALLFIDDGRLVEGGDSPTEITSLLSTDLWQAIKALAPHKVPSGHRLERLSMLGRHLLHASVSMDLGYGAAALRNLRVVVAVDQEQEQFLVGELKAWTFFGLDPKNLVVLPLPRFYGFVQDLKQDTLAHVRASSRLMLGTGYAMHLLNSPAQAYTLDSGACNPACLPGTVLEWLRGLKVSWLYAGMFSDVERLRPQALVDADFLAAAMHAADRQGCNMAVEVMMGENERDVRGQDSLVLSRLLPDGSPGGNCNLKASAMRTVRSYQLMQEQIANPEAIYVATSRYLFRVQALQRLLSDCATHMPNVRLHGFYAYATFDIADLTTFPDARCAAILGKGARGPPLSEVVYGRAWLAQAAAALEAQDKVNEFRQRAIDLVHAELLGDSPTRALRSLATIPGAAPASTHVELTPRCCSMPSSPTRFRERKQGLQVLLLLAPEHRGLARSALKLARLFIQHIVDRLHDICAAVGAGLVVVPSQKLCGGPVAGLGAEMSSLAFQVSAMIEALTKMLVPGQDLLLLAKTQAFERPGQLTMRSRRVFTQARMAVPPGLRLEERAYAGHMVPELVKAVEAETADVLVVSVAGELPVSKEIEEVLRHAKSSVFIFRNKDAVTAQQPTLALNVVEEETLKGYVPRRR